VPGLVLGLDRGGACKGLAYRVAAADREAVIAYLDAREHSHDVYHARWLSVRLDDGRRVPAYSFVANRQGAQYAGRQPRDRILSLLRAGRGEQGTALEYLENTVRHLDGLGIPDGPLHRFLEEATSSSTAP
jgi:cation transport protein ChaC